MKATKFFKPYNADKYNLTATGRGVYIIKKGEKYVYVGLSYTDVKRTLYRHFQKWTDKRTEFTKKAQVYERVTYDGENRNLFTIKVVFCKTEQETTLLEYLLIKKLKPRDNTLKNSMYDAFDITKTVEKFNNASQWQPDNEEAPF